MQSTVTYGPKKPSKPLLVSSSLQCGAALIDEGGHSCCANRTAAEKRRIYDDDNSPISRARTRNYCTLQCTTALILKRIIGFFARKLPESLTPPTSLRSQALEKIQFFQPLQDGELPNITKPFLAMEQIPIISANKMDTGNGQTEPVSSKHMVHTNASLLALGIFLCELHYCTPVESWQNDTETGRNVNTDYYTSLDLLKNLEVDAGVDYYLATKACLQWEYFLAGELTSFESARVRRLFYQNVVKRLESEICKSWRLRLEDLNSLDSRENELCWGLFGREVVRRQTSKPESSARSNEDWQSLCLRPPI